MSERQVTDEWLTKAEVAKKIGKSLTAVTRLTAAGRLTPVVVKDGAGVAQNRYDPQEVAEICADPKMQPSADDRREVFAEYQLDTVKAVIGLIREPREKIDSLQFEMIDRLMKRIVDLEAQVEAGRRAREEALDQSAERALAMKMQENDMSIKKMATERVLTTIGKLITGPDNVKFTPEQWEEMLIANGDGEEQFLTPEQVKQGKEIVARWKASTNGKAVVETVKKTVVDATGNVSQ
jgi:hypothetical protein